MQSFDQSISAAFDRVSAPSLVQLLQRAGGQSAVTGGGTRRIRLTRSVCSDWGRYEKDSPHKVSAAGTLLPN